MRMSMSADQPSWWLLESYRAGDEGAASEIFRRYVGRLTVFARARLAPRVAARVDADDVVLSAYRSFFVRARDGHFTLERNGDLWRLLVAITLNKIRRQVAFERAQKRSVDRERPDDSSDAALPVAAGNRRIPGAIEAIAAADELESIMAQLAPFKRRLLELRLGDCSIAEIAADTGRSERTVRRALAELQTLLERRLLDGGA
jgi:RNA polymerase sigma factor (sigma-70 family)